MARPKRASTGKAKKYTDSGDDEESEYEQPSDEDQDDDDDEEFEADEPEAESEPSEEEEDYEDEKPKAAPKAKKAPAAKKPAKPRPPKKRKKIDYNSDSADEEELMPTEYRKTKAGGYAHTKKSRARISKANSGNTPWNKGRKRSEADKAKIAAAVRLRNRAILLAKLEKFNMTEEEFRAKQKEIKYLRERVRRAKVMSAKKKEQLDKNTIQMQSKLDEMIADRDKVVKTKMAPPTKEAMRKLQEQTPVEDGIPKKDKPPKKKAEPKRSPSSPKEDKPPEEKSDASLQPAQESAKECITVLPPENITAEEAAPSIEEMPEEVISKKKKKKKDKRKDIVATIYPKIVWAMEWTQHELDSSESSCPNGGPGGLICCETCTDSYSQYMTTTVREQEVQRMESVSNEVEELLGYIEETRMQLMVTTQSAQLKAPPPPSKTAQATLARKYGGRKDATEQEDLEETFMNWDVTSTLDMMNFEPTAARI